MKIADKLAVVTGAASGIGAATAKYLASKGAKLILVDVNQEGLDKTASETKGEVFHCDVTKADAVEVLGESIAKIGTPRILINCAGIAPAKRVVGRDGPMDLSDFEKVINVNLIGSFNVLRVLGTIMSMSEPVNESKERGVIINTASIAAFEGQIGQAAYSASKGAIVSMTLPIAREFARFGIRVMTIAPGLVETPMLLSMPQEVQDSLAAQVPYPQRLAKPEEYAHLAEQIITNEMLNGSVIRLDGAIRMQPK